MNASNNIYLQNLHVRGTGEQSPVLRMRLATALARTAMRPTQARPAEILYIRHLEDPMPGKLFEGMSSRKVNIAWAKSLQQVLDEKYTGAFRPSTGVIPGNATAVCFSDESELLSCLCYDLAGNLAHTRWWWKSCLRVFSRQTHPGDRIAQIFLEKLELVPAIVGNLQQWNKITAIAPVLNETAAEKIIAGLFNVHAINQVGVAGFQETQAFPGRTDNKLSVEIEENKSQFLDERRRHWDALLAIIQSVSGIENYQPAVQRLVGIALSLIKVPAMARNADYLKVMDTWINNRFSVSRDVPFHKSDATDSKEVIVENDRLIFADPEVTATSWLEQHESSEVDIENEIQPEDHNNDPDDLQSIPSKSQVKASRAERETHGRRGSGIGDQLARTENQPDLRVQKSGELAQEVEAKTEPAKMPDFEASQSEETEQTIANRELGVVPHAEEGPEVDEKQDWLEGSPFTLSSDLIDAVINTRWAGLFYLINVIDKLDIVNRLDAPETSLSRLGSWRFLVRIADVLVAEDILSDPLCEALEAMHLSFETDLASASIEEDILNEVIDFLLGLDGFDDKKAGQPEFSHLLKCPGRVYFTSSHVDIVISMDQVKLPIRMAGLDFNPGWQPLFGRVIQFHFE